MKIIDMKRPWKIISFFLIVSNLIFTNVLFINAYVPESQANKPYICVYVENSIAPMVQPEIKQYKADLIAAGYNVSIYNWTLLGLPPFDKIGEVNVLKTNITAEYNLNNLIGVCLVGSMPYAMFDNNTHYPCDLFLMDLDGNWVDQDGDTVLDLHSDGTGDMYPEIFVGRIDPYCTTHALPTLDLQKYFQRNHNYRISTYPRYNNSLMYIDNDWETWSDEWKSDMLNLYSDVTVVNNSVQVTNSTNYLNEIIKQYDFCHVFIHSDQVTHYFDAYTVPTTVSTAQINGLGSPIYFWNLYCCYAADISTVDNLASQYLFGTGASLAVFGSTRTGGFLMNSYLYTPLDEGKSLGESFKQWWSNDIYEPLYGHGPDDNTTTGNILLGDPFLQIRTPVDNGDPGGNGNPWLTYFLIILTISIPLIGLAFLKIKRNKNKIETSN